MCVAVTRKEPAVCRLEATQTQDLGSSISILVFQLQDLAYLLADVEGKGYKAYNDILGKSYDRFNIFTIIVPQITFCESLLL